MLATFFLMLREGLEAALIVGIIAAYLVKIGRRDALPKVLFGVAAALGLSIAIGLSVTLTIERLPLVVKETLEGIAAVLAVGVLTWMLFWMRRQGRAIKGELEHGIDIALSKGSTQALVALAFLAVIREGVETVLFLIPILSFNGTGLDTVIGGVLGLVTSVAVGYAIFFAGVRVNLRRFFTVTGTILIFVSAGLVAFAVAEFGEAGLFANAGAAFDLNGVLPDNGPIGSVLRGLFGYRSRPTPFELIGYVAYLIPVLVLFVLDRPLFRRTAAISTALVVAFVLVGCGGGGPSSAAPATPLASGVIAVEAKEYTFTPSTIHGARRVGDVLGQERGQRRARVRDLQGRDRRRRGRSDRSRPDQGPDADAGGRRLHVRVQAEWPRPARDEGHAHRYGRLSRSARATAEIRRATVAARPGYAGRSRRE
jgi:high-affinity iron transporter